MHDMKAQVHGKKALVHGKKVRVFHKKVLVHGMMEMVVHCKCLQYCLEEEHEVFHRCLQKCLEGGHGVFHIHPLFLVLKRKAWGDQSLGHHRKASEVYGLVLAAHKRVLA